MLTTIKLMYDKIFNHLFVSSDVIELIIMITENSIRGIVSILKYFLKKVFIS